MSYTLKQQQKDIDHPHKRLGYTTHLFLLVKIVARQNIEIQKLAERQNQWLEQIANKPFRAEVELPDRRKWWQFWIAESR